VGGFWAGVALGRAKVTLDQDTGELALPARELESVRLQFLGACVARAKLVALRQAGGSRPGGIRR
jgi:hypothetical protein